MIGIRIWFLKKMNLMQLVSSEKISIKKLVILYKTNLSTRSSLLLMLKFCFSMLVLHVLLVTTITSSFMFKNCVIIVCMMVHGIILQYAQNFMDINFRMSSTREERTYMILCVLFMHAISRTLQQNLIM